MDTSQAPRCCGGDGSCVFTQALKAREAECACARRSEDADGVLRIDCSSSQAHCACGAMLAQIYALVRARLRWPGPQQPLRHHQALTLQVGTVEVLRQVAGSRSRNIAELSQAIGARPGGWAATPVSRLADALTEWVQARRDPARGRATRLP
jgi:hypothetical protein